MGENGYDLILVRVAVASCKRSKHVVIPQELLDNLYPLVSELLIFLTYPTIFDVPHNF